MRAGQATLFKHKIRFSMSYFYSCMRSAYKATMGPNAHAIACSRTLWHALPHKHKKVVRLLACPTHSQSMQNLLHLTLLLNRPRCQHMKQQQLQITSTVHPTHVICTLPPCVYFTHCSKYPLARQISIGIHCILSLLLFVHPDHPNNGSGQKRLNISRLSCSRSILVHAQKCLPSTG